MTKSTDINQLTPVRIAALIAAALVFNLAEITLIGMLLACMAMGIAHVFGAIEHTQWKVVLLVIVSVAAIAGSMIAISSRNVPFLCKQADLTTPKAAQIFALIGAIIWLMAALFIFLISHHNLSVGNLPIYAGLLGGAAMQLFMGFRRYRDVGGLGMSEAPKGFDSIFPPTKSVESGLSLKNAPAENTLDGGTITLPTAEELKQEL